MKEMILSELLKSDLINDDTRIVIIAQLNGEAKDVRAGNWFHDRILELHDAEIDSMHWYFDRNPKVEVYLK